LIKNISIVIIAKDAQETIQETLQSTLLFKEVILYLNNSTDNTKEIASHFKNVKIIEGDFLGFGKTKNKAASYASNEWIFSLDSDEVILKELSQEIKNLPLENTQDVFIIKRDNYFLNKKIKYSGWGKDYLLRIYNKTQHSFNDNKVHEFVTTTQQTHKIYLQNSFKHHAITDINQFLYKIIKYSDLAAEGKKTCYFLTVVFKAHWAFFKTYILQLGFLDGYRGFIIATSNFIGKFYRYTKRYIHCK